ncbi:hypothetical protein AVEN_251895-1 [Araneus ventricosus]|uniref:Integrase zinc-binding domain-containing protein n=1 Tax=Araneus ventricosus TaxID=182803 RepID=A0A4Y2U3N2_ARAVE|nr:hypothetical protein AVEN_251895-1 [Araneus ventricosus]
METHVFEDASTNVYGAVTYIRHKMPFEVQFVLSKTRVAPVKKLTLPRLELLREIPEEITELKGFKTLVQNITVQKPEHLIHYLLDKCPSWDKVVHVAAWCLRFIKNLQNTNDKIKTFLLTNEFEEAQNFILKYVQEHAFAEEIQRLKINKPIKTYSKLLALCPYFDGNDILRVGGRLRHANLHDNTKYPVILPKEHVVTDFIIQHYHLKYLHAGNQLFRSAIRQRYWILCAPVEIKRIIWKCVRCARLRSAFCQQLMGDLPPSRVNPSRAFSNVGVDLSGLLQVKSRKVKTHEDMPAYL